MEIAFNIYEWVVQSGNQIIWNLDIESFSRFLNDRNFLFSTKSYLVNIALILIFN